MNERFELYDVVNLRFVDVRKYNGVEDGLNSWTFLGYDVVKVDRNGKATRTTKSKSSKNTTLANNVKRHISW